MYITDDRYSLANSPPYDSEKDPLVWSHEATDKGQNSSLDLG